MKKSNKVIDIAKSPNQMSPARTVGHIEYAKYDNG